MVSIGFNALYIIFHGPGYLFVFVFIKYAFRFQSVIDFPEVDIETKERLIHAPEFQSEQVEHKTKEYRDQSLQLLEV